MYNIIIFIIIPIINIMLLRKLLKYNDELLENWLLTLVTLILCIAPYVNAFVLLLLFIVNMVLIEDSEKFKGFIKKILFLKGDI